MQKKQSKPKRGRPPVAAFGTEPLSKQTMIRISEEDERAFAQEAERLSALTGTKWSVAAYLRLAGREFLGKHLAP